MNNDHIFKVTAVHAGSGSLGSSSVYVQAPSEEIVEKYVEEELKPGNKSLDATAWKLLGGCDGDICSKQHLFYIFEVKPVVVLDGKKNEPLAEKSIEDLELSVRAHRFLKGVNINTIGELIQKTEEDMFESKNFSRESFDEIKSTLNGIGLSLKKVTKIVYINEDMLQKPPW